MKEDIIESANLNKLSELRNLLLDDVNEKQVDIQVKIDEFELALLKLKTTLNEPNLLRSKVSSLLDEQTQEMKFKFDELFGQEVAEIIKNSEPQLIKALTPIMGKLIKKWITFELGKVQSKLNEQIKNNPVRAFFDKIIGKNPIENVCTATIQDVLIIENKTGLLICKYAEENPINKNQMAGYMKAIVSYGEEALKVGYKEKIKEWTYETYRVVIHTDADYFGAIVLDGHSTQDFTIKLKNTVGVFISNHLNGKDFSKEIPEKELSKKLRKILNTKV